MVEGVHKLGEEVIRKAMRLVEMVISVGVTRHHEGKGLIKMIELSVMLFWARMRQRHLTQKS